MITGEPGWYVPAGATHCPRCGDGNWDKRRICLTCTNPPTPELHPWQEYNGYGNTCHYPDCRMTEEEHAPARTEVTSFADLARGERVYLDERGAQHAVPIDS